VEAGRGRKRNGLKQAQEKAKQMIATAKEERVSLQKLVQRYEAVEKPEGSTAPNAENATGQLFVTSEEAVSQDVRESDMLFIKYSMKIFQAFDGNDSDALNPSEVRKALTYFNIYLSSAQTPKVMCMFLRDSGFSTPLDESEAELRFMDFCGLLMSIDNYMLKFGRSGIVGYLQGSPPSKRWDVFARVIVPTGVVLQFVIFYLVLPTYR